MNMEQSPIRKMVLMKPPHQSTGAAEEVERRSVHAGVEECIHAENQEDGTR
jgi:hypothetical protein